MRKGRPLADCIGFRSELSFDAPCAQTTSTLNRCSVNLNRPVGDDARICLTRRMSSSESPQYTHPEVRLALHLRHTSTSDDRLRRMCFSHSIAAVRFASRKAGAPSACSLCTPQVHAGMGAHTCQPAAHP
jgi:hypothetical protein